MSCFSRLLGLICAVVPGLLFLAFSVLFFTRWPQLGYPTGPLYSLASLVTGAVCLYLGFGILFGRDREPEPLVTDQAAPVAALGAPVVAASIVEAQPLQAAPLPTEAMPTAATDAATAPPPLELTKAAPVSAALETPETRIRQLASTRPQWQVTAPQLAHMANINMAVADATAREMASNGQAQLQTGPNGETIYIFDLAE